MADLTDSSTIKKPFTISPSDMESGLLKLGIDNENNSTENNNNDAEHRKIYVKGDHFETSSGMVINDVDGWLSEPGNRVGALDLYAVEPRDVRRGAQVPNETVLVINGVTKKNIEDENITNINNNESAEENDNNGNKNNSKTTPIKGINGSIQVDKKLEEKDLRALNFETLAEFLKTDIRFIECYLSLGEEHASQVRLCREYLALLAEMEWHVARPNRRFAPNGEFAANIAGTPFVPLFANLTNEFFFLRKRFEDFQEYLLLDIVAVLDSFVTSYSDSISQLSEDFTLAISKCERDLSSISQNKPMKSDLKPNINDSNNDSSNGNDNESDEENNEVRRTDELIREQENNLLLGFKTQEAANRAVCLRALFRVLHPLRLSLHRLELLRIEKIRTSFFKYIKASNEFARSFTHAFSSAEIVLNHQELTPENVLDKELYNILLSTSTLQGGSRVSTKLLKKIDQCLEK